MFNINTKKNAVLIASGLAIGLFAAPSLAQVAPPPTKPAAEKPEYTPAPPVTAPTPTPVPSAKPSEPKPQTVVNAKKSRGDIEDLPINVPYPKLAQPGPDGRILRLRQSPDILALRSNPNVGPVSVEKIMPVIYSRRSRHETMVVENLDLYWALSSGLIDNLNMADINQMGRVADMLKPLVSDTSLSQELENRGILTRVQGGMNQYIVREYKKAITDEIQVLDGENGLQEVMRFVLDDSISESRLTYEALIAEAFGQIGDLVKKANATSSQAQDLIAMQAPLIENPGEQFIQLQKFDEAFRMVPLEEAMTILQTMRDGRKFPVISPMIKPVDVLHDRKKVYEGSGFDVITKDSKGNVIEKKKADENDKEAEEEKPQG